MGVEKELGTITKGKIGNVLITKPIPSVEYIPYAYGENKIERVILNK
jgi:imidazolonepropionase